jgi:dihydrofolate reductase
VLAGDPKKGISPILVDAQLLIIWTYPLLALGLVDEFQMIVCPIIVGGGKRFLPDGMRLDLELFEVRSFGKSVVVLRYSVRR